ncbi:MAG: 6-phosphogluconolactonase [Phycisphaerae bacterium]
MAGVDTTNPFSTPGDSGLPGRSVRRPSVDLATDALLADLFIHATNCVRAFGDFHLAVSAGEQIEPALMRLMYDPGFRDFPWTRTRLWMVDELDVPGDDPRRRSTRLLETIVACSGMPEAQFLPLTCGDGPRAYEARLREHLEWRERGQDRIDCCLFATRPVGDIEAFTSHAGVVLGEEFIRSARLISVLVSEPRDAAAESLQRWALTNRHRLVPLGGDLVWYLGDREDPGIALAD